MAFIKGAFVNNQFKNLRLLLVPVRRKMFYKIKNVFWKILRFLNPDFELSTTSTGIISSEFGTTFPKSGFLNVGSAVVINSNNTLANEETYDFYLRGIFQEKELCDFVRKGLKLNFQVMTFEEIEMGLNQFLLENSRSTIGFRLLSDFYRHKEQVNANCIAYTTKEKLNPNAVFWPNPTDSLNHRSLYTELPFVKKIPLINKQTKIVSAGSCFATEIAHALQKNGYNYLIKENNKGKSGSYENLEAKELPSSSAAWGIIFNTRSFRQLVEKAFGIRQLPKILWTMNYKGKKKYLDPFRENIAFDSPESFEKNYDEHIGAVREALLEMDVFIITLGLNEVWYFKADGSVFSRSPWKISPSLVSHKIMTVEENVQDLLRMTEILREYNPEVKIIVTLSPIGLHATFRGQENHVVTANTHSKAVLRVAAEEFSKKCPGVYYFPSYEMVTVCSKNPWEEDERHVNPETVARVMKLFYKMFTEED